MPTSLRRRAVAPSAVAEEQPATPAPKTKKSKKAPAPAPVADINPPESAVVPTFGPLDPTAMAQAFDEAGAAGGSGEKTPFIKLTGGDNYLRLLPVPFQRKVANKLRVGGRFWEALDLAFVFSDPDLAGRALKAGKLTRADQEAFNLYGDPFQVASDRIQAAGLKEPKLWPDRRYLFVALNRADGRVGVWDVSGKAYNALRSQFAEEPALFNLEDGFDIKISGNGQEGNLRRYSDPVVMRKSSPANVPEVTPIPDLREFLVRRVVPFAAKVAQLFNVHGETLRALGLTPAAFGLSDLAAEVAVPASAEDEE